MHGVFASQKTPFILIATFLYPDCCILIAAFRCFILIAAFRFFILIAAFLFQAAQPLPPSGDGEESLSAEEEEGGEGEGDSAVAMPVSYIPQTCPLVSTGSPCSKETAHSLGPQQGPRHCPTEGS
jgi:hypothetical protein